MRVEQRASWADWCPSRRFYLLPLGLLALAVVVGVVAVVSDTNWMKGLTALLVAAAGGCAVLIALRRSWISSDIS